MGIENIIAALICLVAAVVYTVLAIRAEKARCRSCYEKIEVEE